MDHTGKPPPTREERLAAKLRENLRRRKAQARGRDGGEPVDGREDARDGDTESGLSKPGTPR